MTLVSFMHMGLKYLSSITGVTVHVQGSEQAHQLVLVSTPAKGSTGKLRSGTLEEGGTVIRFPGIEGYRSGFRAEAALPCTLEEFIFSVFPWVRKGNGLVCANELSLATYLYVAFNK